MCGCGGKKFSSPSATQRTGTTVVSKTQQAAQSSARTVVQSSGVTFGRAPTIQPMQRKTV